MDREGKRLKTGERDSNIGKERKREKIDNALKERQEREREKKRVKERDRARKRV